MHLIDTTGPGGAETVFVQLADKIRHYGYQSVVVLRGKGWLYETLKRKGVKPIIADAKGSLNVRYLARLLKLARQHRVDLIHSHLLGSNVYAALAGLLLQIPVIGTFHGMVDIHPDERWRNLKRWVMRLGISQYVTVSRSLAETISSTGILNPKKTSVIYNGVSLNTQSKSSAYNLRQCLGLPEQTTIIGALGNIRPAKAYDILLNAVPEILLHYPSAHFVVAGHQQALLMKSLQKQMQGLGIAKQVHFIGFVTDTAAYLRELDIFVLSSTCEGFSIATIEAQASQVPVVATRCGGPEEIITHGETGWLVEKNQPGALAKGICTVLGIESLRSRIIDAGYKHVEEKFSLSAMLENYHGLYQQTLGIRAKQSA